MKTHLKNALMMLLAPVFVLAMAWSPLDSAALAQDEKDNANEKQPAPQQAKPLRVAVSAVRGNVQVGDSVKGEWQPAKVGMVLPLGAEVRTALFSAVQLKVEPDQIITLDRLGTIQVITAVRQDGKVKTDVGMKYGRTRYDIGAAGEQHEARVFAPGRTMAVRGTKFGHQNDALTDTTWSIQDQVNLTVPGRGLVVGLGGAGKAKVDQEDPISPGEQARRQTSDDPKTAGAARTHNEDDLIETDASGRLDKRQDGVDSQLALAKRQEFSQITFSQAFLEITLDWDIPINTETLPINLTVTDPQGKTLPTDGVPGRQGNIFVREGKPFEGQYINSPFAGDGVSGALQQALYAPPLPGQNFTVKVKNTGETAPGFAQLDIRIVNDPKDGVVNLGAFNLVAELGPGQTVTKQVNPVTRKVGP